MIFYVRVWGLSFMIYIIFIFEMIKIRRGYEWEKNIRGLFWGKRERVGIKLREERNLRGYRVYNKFSWGGIIWVVKSRRLLFVRGSF